MGQYLKFVFVVLFCVQAQGREPISAADLEKIVEEFSYDVDYEIIKLKRTNRRSHRCWKHDAIFKVDFPDNSKEPLEVEAAFYQPNPNKTELDQVPVVIQLPPMGGVTVLDRWMGSDLCKRKVAALIIKTDFSGFDKKADLPPVDDHNQAFMRTTAAVKTMIDFSREHESLNGDKMGLIGISLGGILGSFSYGVLDELSAAFFIVTGSDAPHILAHSTNSRVKRLRELRMEEEGFILEEEYEEYLRENLRYDSFDTGQRIPTETLLLSISNNDDAVPTSRQKQWAEATGNPETYTSDSGHTGTVIDTLLWGSSRKFIIDFFEERFAMDNPRLDSDTREFLRDLDITANY